jgi:hypothetical protein
VVTINNDATGKRTITINSSEIVATAQTLQTRRLDVCFQEMVCFDLALDVRLDSDDTRFSSPGYVTD